MKMSGYFKGVLIFSEVSVNLTNSPKDFFLNSQCTPPMQHLNLHEHCLNASDGYCTLQVYAALIGLQRF